MARITNTKKQENAAPIAWAVDRVRQWDDESVSFDLQIAVAPERILTVYGCRIAKGRQDDFVSFPSRKGKDGKYYSHAYLRLTQAEQDAIIAKIQEELG